MPARLFLFVDPIQYLQPVYERLPLKSTFIVAVAEQIQQEGCVFSHR